MSLDAEVMERLESDAKEAVSDLSLTLTDKTIRRLIKLMFKSLNKQLRNHVVENICGWVGSIHVDVWPVGDHSDLLITVSDEGDELINVSLSDEIESLLSVCPGDRKLVVSALRALADKFEREEQS